MRNLLILFSFCLAFTQSLFAHSLFQDESDDPVLYFTDEQVYDADLGVLILRGNVEFLYKGDVLEADYVTYSEPADIVTASGKQVRLRKADGDIVFGEYIELTGDLKEGFIRQAKTLLKDDVRIVAAEGRRVPNRQEFDQAVYTPCKICGEGDTPTWQLNAGRVVKDEEAKKYYFTDATMRFLGIPVMYFPFLYHPTERQSGLLTPVFGPADKNLGWYFAQPLYLVLGREDDLTLTPVLYTSENPLGIAEYRRAFSFGNFSVEGSFIKPKSNTFTERVGKQRKKRKVTVPHHRGHVWAKADFSVTEAIRFRGRGGWVSDQTYFRKFNFFGHKSDVSLDSEALLEGFWDQDYAAIKVMHFQTLVSRVDQNDIADALPYAEYHAISRKDPLGGRFYFDTSFLNLTRVKGRNVQRGVGVMGWRLPAALPFGQFLTLFAEGRGDIYNVEDAAKPRIDKPGKDGTHRRLFPRGGVEVRWPFTTMFMNNVTIIEPIGQVILSSKALNRPSIPNEDSVGFEFSDSNILSDKRIPGRDLVEEGSRADYGLQVISKGTTLGNWEAFIGQTFDFNDPNNMPIYKQQGLSHRSSDYVMRLNAQPAPGWVDVYFRGRFTRNRLHSRFIQVGGIVGPKELKGEADYIFVSKLAGAPNMTDFKQISFKISSQFLENWTADFASRYDFSKDRFGKKTPRGGLLSQSFGIKYVDDCFNIRVGIARTFYRDRDVKPGTAGEIAIEFKNLGGFSQKVDLIRGKKDDDRKSVLF